MLSITIILQLLLELLQFLAVPLRLLWLTRKRQEMANAPAIAARATVTARDLLNNNIAKAFLSVGEISFDFNKGTVNVVDVTGSFFFGLTPVTTVTFTIVAGVNGQYTIVVS